MALEARLAISATKKVTSQETAPVIKATSASVTTMVAQTDVVVLAEAKVEVMTTSQAHQTTTTGAMLEVPARATEAKTREMLVAISGEMLLRTTTLSKMLLAEAEALGETTQELPLVARQAVLNSQAMPGELILQLVLVTAASAANQQTTTTVHLMAGADESTKYKLTRVLLKKQESISLSLCCFID